MKIAIIEDEPVHADLLEGYLQGWSQDRQTAVKTVRFSSAESFLFDWETEQDLDALFVDIQMKKMNGMEMAKQVRERDGRVSIIFTTGMADFMEEGYEVEAMRYLLKPINQEKVWSCMDKIRVRNENAQYILVHGSDGVRRLAAEQINYIEAWGHGSRIEIWGAAGQSGTPQTDFVSENISELEEMLKEYGFIRCHRSYLCGIRNIRTIGRTEITFDSGTHIPVSRRLYKEENQAFIRYFRKG